MKGEVGEGDREWKLEKIRDFSIIQSPFSFSALASIRLNLDELVYLFFVQKSESFSSL